MSHTDQLLIALASILSSGDTSDLAPLDACLDALDKEAPIEKTLPPQEALMNFMEAHSGLLSVSLSNLSIQARQSRPQKRLARRWAQLAASIAITFIFSTCIAQAGLWIDFANWTKEIFSFGATQPVAPSPYVPAIQDVMESINNDGVKLPSNPLPGYEHVSTLTDFTKNSSLAYSTFEDAATRRHYVVSVRHFESAEFAQNCLLEKTEATVETYINGGITHYIMSNSDTVTATWVNGPYLCTINGTASLLDLRTLLESTYN